MDDDAETALLPLSVGVALGEPVEPVAAPPATTSGGPACTLVEKEGRGGVRQPGMKAFAKASGTTTFWFDRFP